VPASPDLVLMDIRMPEVIVLTTFDSGTLGQGLGRAGRHDAWGLVVSQSQGHRRAAMTPDLNQSLSWSA